MGDAKLANKYGVGVPFWILADGDFSEYDGAKFLNGWQPCNRLPVEFFNHQLMNYDPECDDDIIKLCTSFGIPRLPKWRYIEGGKGRGRGYRQRRAAIALSDKAIKENHAEAQCQTWVSLNEVRFALRDLQEWSRTLFEWLKGESDEWAARTIVNKTARTQEIFPPYDYDPTIKATSDLTEAVCTQIVDTLVTAQSDSFRWRVCEYCDRWYVRSQPKGLFPTKSGKAPNVSKYCCHKCGYNKAKRDYRVRKRLTELHADKS